MPGFLGTLRQNTMICGKDIVLWGMLPEVRRSLTRLSYDFIFACKKELACFVIVPTIVVKSYETIRENMPKVLVRFVAQMPFQYMIFDRALSRSLCCAAFPVSARLLRHVFSD